MLKVLGKAIPVAVVVAALLAACAPGQAPVQVQNEIGTGVALTVQAQNEMSTAVAQTLTAEAPLPTSTQVLLVLPTLTALPTVTPFVVVPGGGGGGSGASRPEYACSFIELRPPTNVFYPGDPIYVVWLITNTGSKDWNFVRELNFDSGREFLTPTHYNLPLLDSGERTSVDFDGNVPEEPGYYEMRYKVTGGLCFPYIDIQVVRRPGNDP